MREIVLCRFMGLYFLLLYWKSEKKNSSVNKLLQRAGCCTRDVSPQDNPCNHSSGDTQLLSRSRPSVVAAEAGS